MTDKVISLSPTMQCRLNFRHDLFDEVDSYKLADDECGDAIYSWLQFRERGDRDRLILGFMWLAKDVVCRFRAHWCDTRSITDELCSEALLILTEFVDRLEDGDNFFNRLQSRISDGLRDFINNNRGTFSASRQKNIDLQSQDLPLEYTFSEIFNDAVNGTVDENFDYIDILDNIERLAETDKEEMQALIMRFLEHDHDINEASLSAEELSAIKRLSEIGRNLL